MRREDLHEIAQRIADQLDREEEARGGRGCGGHDVSNEPRVPAGKREGGQWTALAQRRAERPAAAFRVEGGLVRIANQMRTDTWRS